MNVRTHTNKHRKFNRRKKNATVDATGNLDQSTPGMAFLAHRGKKVGLAFSGATLPTTLEVGFNNDAGTFVPFTDGAIISLPTTLVINSVPANGLVINVDGGSPDFNISSTGLAGPFSQ